MLEEIKKIVMWNKYKEYIEEPIQLWLIMSSIKCFYTVQIVNLIQQNAKIRFRFI